MTVPRPSRRSALSWAVNAVTMVALASAVWHSAQQRPAAQPSLSSTPPASNERQRAPGGATVAATSLAPVIGSAVGIEVESLHRVSFRAAVKP